MRSRWPIVPSVLVCLVPNAPAAAAEFGNGFGVAGGVSLVSDFRFRGISLSDEDVAVQGTITFAHDGGLYAGTWASSLEDSPLSGHTVVDRSEEHTSELHHNAPLVCRLLRDEKTQYTNSPTT